MFVFSLIFLIAELFYAVPVLIYLPSMQATYFVILVFANSVIVVLAFLVYRDGVEIGKLRKYTGLADAEKKAAKSDASPTDRIGQGCLKQDKDEIRRSNRTRSS